MEIKKSQVFAKIDPEKEVFVIIFYFSMFHAS